MRWSLPLIAAVCLLPFYAAPLAMAQSDAGGDNPVDFIRFDGATYLASAYLSQDDLDWSAHQPDAFPLGPLIGSVSPRQVNPADAFAYPNEPCHWTVPDAVAPGLTPGDPIHAVPDFSTDFRVATRHNGEIRVYQVWCRDDAYVGADLFDIHGRILRISVTADLSEKSGFAVIDDPAVLALLTDMLLAGKVVPEEDSAGDPVTFQLIVQLDDGSTFRISTAPGEVLWGLSVIEVPPEFDAVLAAAWPP